MAPLSFRGRLKQYGRFTTRPNQKRVAQLRRQAELIAGDLPPIPETGSVVYFIQSVSNGLIKIGYTSSLRERLGRFMTGSGDRFDILLVVPGGREEEKRFHVQFDALRQRGEWFEPGESLLLFIAEKRGLEAIDSDGNLIPRACAGSQNVPF